MRHTNISMSLNGKLTIRNIGTFRVQDKNPRGKKESKRKLSKDRQKQ